jgi:hypothetical protein
VSGLKHLDKLMQDVREKHARAVAAIRAADAAMPKPLVFGEIKNVPEVTVEANSIFQFHDGPLIVSRVYDIGEGDAYMQIGDELDVQRWAAFEAECDAQEKAESADSAALGRALGVMRRKVGGA